MSHDYPPSCYYHRIKAKRREDNARETKRPFNKAGRCRNCNDVRCQQKPTRHAVIERQLKNAKYV